MIQGTLNPVIAGTGVNIYPKADIFESDKDYFVAMKAFDERNTPSKVSNVAKNGRFIPPGKIQDLKVNLESSNITMNFTAPGEDAQIGKGSQLSTHKDSCHIHFPSFSIWIRNQI